MSKLCSVTVTNTMIMIRMAHRPNWLAARYTMSFFFLPRLAMIKYVETNFASTEPRLISVVKL
jgi:hypothetical protein